MVTDVYHSRSDEHGALVLKQQFGALKSFKAHKSVDHLIGVRIELFVLIGLEVNLLKLSNPGKSVRDLLFGRVDVQIVQVDAFSKPCRVEFGNLLLVEVGSDLTLHSFVNEGRAQYTLVLLLAADLDYGVAQFPASLLALEVNLEILRSLPYERAELSEHCFKWKACDEQLVVVLYASVVAASFFH